MKQQTYSCWCEEPLGETEDDAKTIYAHDAERAAEEYAELMDEPVEDTYLISVRWQGGQAGRAVVVHAVEVRYMVTAIPHGKG